MIDEKKCYLFGRNPQLNDFQIDHTVSINLYFRLNERVLTPPQSSSAVLFTCPLCICVPQAPEYCISGWFGKHAWHFYWIEAVGGTQADCATDWFKFSLRGFYEGKQRRSWLIQLTKIQKCLFRFIRYGSDQQQILVRILWKIFRCLNRLMEHCLDCQKLKMKSM